MTEPGEKKVMGHPGLTSNRAGNAGFQSISTRYEHAARRFDYWRSLHPNIDIDVVGKHQGKDFSAQLLHYSALDGSTFGMASYDDVAAHFAKPNGEFVLFSLTLAGSARITQGGATTRAVSVRDGFLALDSTRPMTTLSRNHQHLYLTIPRARVMDALGNDPKVLCDGHLALPSCGVADLLKSHLLMTIKAAKRLNEHAVAAAVRCGVDLALETLAQELEHNGHALREGPTNTLHAATLRYIELHLGDSTLTTDRIAHAMGCSRAHLHRVFAERGEQVGETIRLARLEAARMLLASSMNLSIEQAAYSCGFENASSFSRAFRNHAGMPPSVYRHATTRS